MVSFFCFKGVNCVLVQPREFLFCNPRFEAGMVKEYTARLQQFVDATLARFSRRLQCCSVLV